MVSIHAPARERTFAAGVATLPLMFQSTLPRESEREFGWFSVSRESFNPRSRARANCRYLTCENKRPRLPSTAKPLLTR